MGDIVRGVWEILREGCVGDTVWEVRERYCVRSVWEILCEGCVGDIVRDMWEIL